MEKGGKKGLGDKLHLFCLIWFHVRVFFKLLLLCFVTKQGDLCTVGIFLDVLVGVSKVQHLFGIESWCLLAKNVLIWLCRDWKSSQMLFRASEKFLHEDDFSFFMSVCTLKSRSLYGFVTVSSGSLRWSLSVLLLGRTCCSHIYCCVNFPCYKVSFFLLLSPQPSLSYFVTVFSVCICCFPGHTYSCTHKGHTHFIVHLTVLIFVGSLGSNK